MLNKVILAGRLTRDPEVRYAQSGSGETFATARYTLAVNRDFKRNGEDEADFINCSVTGKRAEFAEKFLTKGKLIAVCGRLQVRTYEQNGQRQWITEVVVDEHHFLESKAASEAHAASSGAYGGASGAYGGGYDNAAHSQTPAPVKKPQGEPDGFFAIDESLDDEDLPF